MERTFKLEAKKKVILVQVLYGETDYYIALCKCNDLTKYRLRIIEHASNTVLWDNVDSDSILNHVKLNLWSTQRIAIEISNLTTNASPPENVGLSIRSVLNYIPAIKDKVTDNENEIPAPPPPPW